MDIEQLLSFIDENAYKRLNYAIETGRWPEGKALTQTERDHAMQVVMLYQSRHNTDAQHMSVEQGGAMKIKSKAELKRDFVKNQDVIVQSSLLDK